MSPRQADVLLGLSMKPGAGMILELCQKLFSEPTESEKPGRMPGLLQSSGLGLELEILLPTRIVVLARGAWIQANSSALLARTVANGC